MVLWFTWAERVARQLLDALTLADGTAIERGGVRTAASAFLEATPTAAVAHRPLGPRRPATVHWNMLKRRTHTHTQKEDENKKSLRFHAHDYYSYLFLI